MCKTCKCSTEIKPKSLISFNICQQIAFLIKKTPQNICPGNGETWVSYSTRLKKTQPMYLQLVHGSTSPALDHWESLHQFELGPKEVNFL